MNIVWWIRDPVKAEQGRKKLAPILMTFRVSLRDSCDAWLINY
jgi:hypothetical protein